MRIREFFKDIHQKVIAVYFKIKKYMIYSNCKLIESHVKYGLFLFLYSLLFKIIENNSFLYLYWLIVYIQSYFRFVFNLDNYNRIK